MKSGHVEFVKALLEDAGADTEAKGGSNGYTALMLASEKGHVDAVQALLDAGADIEAKDYYGWTALMLASRYGHVEVVQALLDAGADNSYLYRVQKGISIFGGACFRDLAVYYH